MSDNHWETQPRKDKGEFTFRYEFWKHLGRGSLKGFPLRGRDNALALSATLAKGSCHRR